MLLRERKYNKCTTCNHSTTLIHDEAYGCDECFKEIDMSKPESDYLQGSVHHHDKEVEWRHYCSWKCALKNLRKAKTDYFISLPLLSFDSKKKGMQAKDFFALMK